MVLTMSSVPTLITDPHPLETKSSSSDEEDSCIETVLSPTSSSDLSIDTVACSTSFPPNGGINFPSFFLCPITKDVMIDPVIDREGNTFERSTLLRWLVLYDQESPLTGNVLKLDELNTDTFVKSAIDKARKDAWVRYILDFEKDKSVCPKSKQYRNDQSLGSSKSLVSKMSKNKFYDDRNSKAVATKSPKQAGKANIHTKRKPPFPIRVDKSSRKMNNKKVTPLPPAKASSVLKLTTPQPPPAKSKRRRSNKSSHSETKSLSETNTPVSALTITPVISSNASACSNITFGIPYNGWAVQLGVHRVVCSSPGLIVTTDVHRRSTTVQQKCLNINGKVSHKDLILPPGSYVEILETQVHGGRVRGRISWEVDENFLPISKVVLKKKRIRIRKKKTSKVEKITKINGWISLQWLEKNDREGRNENDRSKIGFSNQDHRFTDEDEGPWTEPIPLGVYRITFSAGLPLRENPERDSLLFEELEEGRCVEVVETQVKDKRVRARCIVPPMHGVLGGKFQSGWISLLNVITGASGAQLVPLGAYIAVAESGCVITEGGKLDSRKKGKLTQGSCMEVVATRIEEGAVRGLIATGGHVTLFIPKRRIDRAGIQGEDGRIFAMPVPLGTYQIIRNGVNITTSISSSSPVSAKLKLDACAEITETHVEDGRVRGRISAVGYGGVSMEARGWLDLFEPTCRWAKLVSFQGAKPLKANLTQARETI